MAEIVSLSDLAEVTFKDLYRSYNNAMDINSKSAKQRADIIDAILSEVYLSVFKPSPGESTQNGSKSKLKTYDVQEVESITELIIRLNQLYGGVIKLIQFSNLIGINRYTLNLWEKANRSSGYIFKLSDTEISEECSYINILLNKGEEVKYYGNRNARINSELSTFRFDVYKKLREAMRAQNTNGLASNPMGEMAIANNDEDVGKMWAQKGIDTQTQPRQVLDASQLRILVLPEDKNTSMLTDSGVYDDNTSDANE